MCLSKRDVRGNRHTSISRRCRLQLQDVRHKIQFRDNEIPTTAGWSNTIYSRTCADLFVPFPCLISVQELLQLIKTYQARLLNPTITDNDLLNKKYTPSYTINLVSIGVRVPSRRKESKEACSKALVQTPLVISLTCRIRPHNDMKFPTMWGGYSFIFKNRTL